MHALGTSGELWVEKADGARVPVLEIPRYDFDWQLTYELAEPIRFEDGDQLGLSCTWDNTREEDVTWGEGTNDEMCAANVYISEP